MDNWLCIADDDLEFILSYDPDRERSASRATLADVIREIQAIIEDSMDEGPGAL